MKYLKLFENFESGPRIDLDDNELEFLNSILDEYIEEIVKIKPGDLKNLGYEKNDHSYWKEVSKYNYTSNDGVPCSVTFYIGYSTTASGFMSTGDKNNPHDQRICMCWNVYYPMFGSIISKIFKSLYNIDAKELFRQTLYHEFIHAKDPHINHSTPINRAYSLDPHIYYASSAEFYTMTGQLLEAVENRVNTILSKDLDKDKYLILKGAIEGLYKFFSADIDAVDRNEAIQRHLKNLYLFIKDDERNILQNILLKVTNFGIDFVNLFAKDVTLSGIAGFDIKVLDSFIYSITQIKYYNQEGYDKFILEVRKCVEKCIEKINTETANKGFGDPLQIDAMDNKTEYYTLQDGKQVGPMSWEELKQIFFKQARLNNGWYDKNINVWKAGMKDWKNAWKLPELEPIFRSLKKGE